MQNNIGEARRSYALTRVDGRFSQEDAAAYFHVSTSTYQKWEQGTGKSLKVETLCAMADLYGTSVDYLLCRTSVPNFEAVRNPGIFERELADVSSRLSQQQKDILIMTARQFAVANEKNTGNVRGDKQFGTLDAVML